MRFFASKEKLILPSLPFLSSSSYGDFSLLGHPHVPVVCLSPIAYRVPVGRIHLLLDSQNSSRPSTPKHPTPLPLHPRDQGTAQAVRNREATRHRDSPDAGIQSEVP